MNMEFSERLFELRRRAGLSQEELANLLGVTRQAVQKWEAGASRPDMDNLTALADYFQVSLDYLVAGKEPPQPAAATVINHHYYPRWQYEYKSSRTLFGLPLVHIHCGPGFCRAKGVIAIGNFATGFIALGGMAAGLISFGGLSLGLLLALGGMALGGAAVGGLAAGVIAWGGVALGLLTIGGMSCGVYSIGGAAIGSKVAIGGAASAPLAIGVAAEGSQAFSVPSGGLSGSELEAVLQAISSACQGLPKWICRLLQYAARAIA